MPRPTIREHRGHSQSALKLLTSTCLGVCTLNSEPKMCPKQLEFSTGVEDSGPWGVEEGWF